jgi:hypothetical protein
MGRLGGKGNFGEGNGAPTLGKERDLRQKYGGKDREGR